jgi:hypothetical protein
MLSLIRKLHKTRTNTNSRDIASDEQRPFDAEELAEKRKEIPPPVSADGLLRRIPAVKEWILAIPVEKSDCAGRWHKRKAILTSKSLILAREDDPYIREEMQLRLVEGVHVSQDTAQTEIEAEKGLKLNAISASFQRHEFNLVRDQVQKEDQNTMYNLSSRKAQLHNPKNSFKRLIGAENQESSGTRFDVMASIEEFGSVVKYSLRTERKHDMDELLRALTQARVRYMRTMPGVTALKRFQSKVNNFYDRYQSWGVMTALILTNFTIDVVEAEMQPLPDSPAARAFHALDILFTVLYTADLATNALANWLRPFLRSGWNLLDLFVIAISIVCLSVESLSQSGVNSLRTIRAVRAVRLFKGVARLREIVDALVASVCLPCSLGHPSSPDLRVRSSESALPSPLFRVRSSESALPSPPAALRSSSQPRMRKKKSAHPKAYSWLWSRSVLVVRPV